MRGAVGTNLGLGTEFNAAFHHRTNHTRFSGRHTTGVEGAHGELRTGLTDGLGRDDAHGFTQVHQFVVSQSPAVALAANRAGRLTGERRAHLHLGNASRLNARTQRRVHLSVAGGDHFPSAVDDVFSQQATDQAGFVLAVVIRGDLDAAGGAAVVFTDDDVLSDVDQAAGEVARVRGAKRGIHQALTSAVGGNDVLGDREAFAEIGANWEVDDLPLRVGHQTAHANQLTHLGHISPGAGVSHHPHRVEWIVLVEVAANGLNQTLIGLSPGVDHLGVTFHLGDFTKPVALLGRRDLIFGLLEQGAFVARNAKIVNRNRHGGLGRETEAQILEIVSKS